MRRAIKLNTFINQFVLSHNKIILCWANMNFFVVVWARCYNTHTQYVWAQCPVTDLYEPTALGLDVVFSQIAPPRPVVCLVQPSLPLEDGRVSLIAFPKCTASELAGFHSTLSILCWKPSGKAVNAIFQVFAMTYPRLGQRPTAFKTNAQTTTQTKGTLIIYCDLI